MFVTPNPVHPDLRTVGLYIFIFQEVLHLSSMVKLPAASTKVKSVTCGAFQQYNRLKSALTLYIFQFNWKITFAMANETEKHKSRKQKRRSVLIFKSILGVAALALQWRSEK